MKTIQLLTFLLFAGSLSAQNVIELVNPSFEDFPRCCKAPRGWFACGEAKEGLNSPDVQPGYFGVSMPAFNGKTYLGMVTRDNDTWEAVSQNLGEKALEKGGKYWFSVFFCAI